MNENVEAQEAPVELDPRAQAMQKLALAERQVHCARRDRDSAVKRVEYAESALAEARTNAARALGVRETELAGLR